MSDKIVNAEHLKEYFYRLYLNGWSYTDIYNNLSDHSRKLDYLSLHGCRSIDGDNFVIFCVDGSSLIYCCGDFYVSVPKLNQRRILKEKI